MAANISEEHENFAYALEVVRQDPKCLRILPCDLKLTANFNTGKGKATSAPSGEHFLFPDDRVAGLTKPNRKTLRASSRMRVIGGQFDL